MSSNPILYAERTLGMAMLVEDIVAAKPTVEQDLVLATVLAAIQNHVSRLINGVEALLIAKSSFRILTNLAVCPFNNPSLFIRVQNFCPYL